MKQQFVLLFALVSKDNSLLSEWYPLREKLEFTREIIRVPHLLLLEFTYLQLLDMSQ